MGMQSTALDLTPALELSCPRVHAAVKALKLRGIRWFPARVE